MHAPKHPLNMHTLTRHVPEVSCVPFGRVLKKCKVVIYFENDISTDQLPAKNANCTLFTSLDGATVDGCKIKLM